MRTITLEEHFATLAFLEGPGRKFKESASIPGSPIAGLLARLCDIGEKRIAEMDAADISVQVLSLNLPGVEQLEASEAITLARETNDQLVAALRKYPSRLAGFATLPTDARNPLTNKRSTDSRSFTENCLTNPSSRYYLDPVSMPLRFAAFRISGLERQTCVRTWSRSPDSILSIFRESR